MPITNKEMLNDWLGYEINQYRKIGYKGKAYSSLLQNEIGKIVAYDISLRKDEYYTNATKNKFLQYYWRRRHNKLGVLLGIHIPINVFDKGLIIYHSQGIIVHADTQCGKDCKLHGLTCIGNNGKEGKANAPVIGDNVDIGVGAKVIGSIHLADNIKIGAGAVVCSSCLENGAVLVGIPAKVKKNT